LDLGEVIVTAKKVETPQEIKVKESRKVYNAPDKELIVSPSMDNFSGDPFSFMSGRLPGVRIVRGVDPCSIYYPDDAEVYVREQFSIEERNCGTDPRKAKIKIRRGALILLDGYAVSSSNLMDVLTLPMNLIDRIDVLNASPLYGMSGANGVINIITRIGVRRDPITLAPNTVIVTVKGFDVSRIFYSPKYNNPEEKTNIPDYRSTIFWEPDLKVEKNKSSKLEFYNSDNPGIIKMTVEGVTGEGIPLSTTISYEVK
jgi:hypothetical protein